MVNDKRLHKRMLAVFHANEREFAELFDGQRLSQYWDSYTGLNTTTVRSWLLQPETAGDALFMAVALEYGPAAANWLAALHAACAMATVDWIQEDVWVGTKERSKSK